MYLNPKATFTTRKAIFADQESIELLEVSVTSMTDHFLVFIVVFLFSMPDTAINFTITELLICKNVKKN